MNVGRLCLLPACVLAWISIGLWLIRGVPNIIGNTLLYLFAGYYILWVGAALVFSRRVPGLIAAADDVSYVGPLIEIMTARLPIFGGVLALYPPSTRKLAMTALIRLLPRLQAHDGQRVSEEDRALLRNIVVNGGYIAFGSYQDSDLMIAIMQGLAHIEDWRCVTMMESAVTGTKDERVRQEASACLSELRDLAAKQRIGETLLRASAADAMASDSLLRAASESSKAEPQEMLRAASVKEIS